MTEILAPTCGGGSSHINVPVYASEAEGNCLGTGAHEDFSVVFRSSLLKFIPHCVIPFLYRIDLKGTAISNTHLSSSFFTCDTHLLSQLRSTLPPSYMMPSHCAPAALAPNENPLVRSSKGSMNNRKLSFFPKAKSLRSDSTT